MADASDPPARNWAVMTQAGSVLTGPVFLGILLDSSFGWSPWGTLGGIALGFLACISVLVRLMNREEQRSRKAKDSIDPPT